MADFAIRNLSVLAYAQGFTQWHYRGNRTVAAPTRLAEMLAPGFFNSAVDMIAVGDHIHISALDGGGILSVAEASDARGGVVVELMCGTARAAR